MDSQQYLALFVTVYKVAMSCVYFGVDIFQRILFPYQTQTAHNYYLKSITSAFIMLIYAHKYREEVSLVCKMSSHCIFI